MKSLFCAVSITLACSTAAFADTCPDWNLPKKADQARFCGILMDILQKAPQPSVRGLYSGTVVPKSIEPLLNSHPMLLEAYDSNSKRTLELIRMIQEAGGAGAQ